MRSGPQAEIQPQKQDAPSKPGAPNVEALGPDSRANAILQLQRSAHPQLGPKAQVTELAEMVQREKKDTTPYSEVLGFADKIPYQGDPLADPNYIEKSTKGIGIPIWGGPLYLKQSNTPGWGDSVVLPRSDIAFVDPLAKQQFKLTAVYKTREAASSSIKGILGEPVLPSPRYPRQLCPACVREAADAAGRPLRFQNVSVSGGFAAFHADDGSPYDSHECFVRGIRCRADEHYFGGIVVQPAAGL